MTAGQPLRRHEVLEAPSDMARAIRPHLALDNLVQLPDCRILSKLE